MYLCLEGPAVSEGSWVSSMLEVLLCWKSSLVHFWDVRQQQNTPRGVCWKELGNIQTHQIMWNSTLNIFYCLVKPYIVSSPMKYKERHVIYCMVLRLHWWLKCWEKDERPWEQEHSENDVNYWDTHTYTHTRTVQPYTVSELCSCHTNVSLMRKRGEVMMKFFFLFEDSEGIWPWCRASPQVDETRILKRLYRCSLELKYIKSEHCILLFIAGVSRWILA